MSTNNALNINAVTPLATSFGGTGLHTSGGPARYVVSSVAGQGGFTTIQAAINQAVSDGASISTPANVWIFPGQYTENLTLQPHVNLSSANGGGEYANQTGVTVFGNAIYAGTGNLSLDNIAFQSNSSSPAISFQSTGAASINVNDCGFFGGATTTSAFECTGSGVFVSLYNSSITAGLIGNTLNITNGSQNLFGCAIQVGPATVPTSISGGSFRLFSCGAADLFSITGGLLQLFDCIIDSEGIVANPTFNVGAAGNLVINNARILSSATSGFMIDGTGALSYGNITATGTSVSINPTLTITYYDFYMGNAIANKLSTTPPASQTSSLILGTAFQNTLGYDVVLTVYLDIATATSANLLLGVGPTVTPTQQTIVNGFTSVTDTIVPVPIYLPNNYYALLSATGTISVSTSGQMIMPV